MTYNQFKNLSKAEYDEFVSKLSYAVHNRLSCYEYATIPMRINIQELPFEAFLKLTKLEHDALISTMLQNINKNESDFQYMACVLEAAEITDMFDNAKFGDAVPEIIGDPAIPS